MARLGEKLSAGISVVTKYVAGAGLILMTGIIGWQVFARFFLNSSPAWSLQAALLLMIWYVFLAAAAGVREGFHIRISVFADRFGPSYRKWAVSLNHVLVGFFGALMVWFGIELVQETWQHVIPTLGLSRGFAYLPIPLSGALIVGFSLEHLIALWRGREVPKQWS